MSRKNKKEDNVLFFVWAKMDSNHRRRKPADLQSAPFGHSGICPYFTAKVILIFLMTKYNQSFLLQLQQIRYLYFLDYHQCALKLALEC